MELPWSASDADLEQRFDPAYAGALALAPAGAVTLRGLPFALGRRAGDPRWLLVDRPIELDLGSGSVSHIVVAHFSDSWRADDGHRPSGRPVGWVLEAGEPLARYEVLVDGDSRAVVDVRRRYEVVDGIIGWGYLPFAAIGHRWDALLDWRGPYGRQGAGDYAPAGHGGPLTILPGAWGGNLTGVADALPSGEGELTLWLTAIPIDARPAGRITMRVTPLANGRPGSDVVIAGVTRFAGSADPLVLSPRRQVIVNGWHGLPTTDLGLVIAARALDSPPVVPGGDGATGGPIGWGSPRPPTDDGATGAPSVLDLAIASDAQLAFGEWSIAATELAGALMSPDGRITVSPVAPDVRVSVRIQAAGAPAAARVRFVAEDGRYRPPIGHREEVNPGAYEDSGLGLVLGADTWAYVPAAFDVDLPVGRVTVEAVHGFEHRPIRRTLDIAPGTRTLELDLDRAIDASAAGWMSVDPHVHFLSPSSALLQAEAEDVDLVQLLACQLGDEMAGVANLPYGILRSADGRTVMAGTENRQNVLGHVALLGARTPVMPLSSGGAPEGRVGAPVDELLADWADRCHASGGLVVGAHFPLPLAEVAACLVEGVIDAVEMQTFAPGLDSPTVLEWYRFLNCGYRVPVLGGTDKMSAEMPLGAVRTYARIGRDAEPGFESWAAAVRAGRTLASSGPLLELTVDGHEPGDVIRMSASGGRVEVSARARAAQPILGRLELVVNGRVVEAADGPPSDGRSLDVALDVPSSAWVALRVRSEHEILSAYRTSMAAHTSPVYLDVADRPLLAPDDAAAILAVIDGTARWLERTAVVRDPLNRARMAARVAAAGAKLRQRLGAAPGGAP